VAKNYVKAISQSQINSKIISTTNPVDEVDSVAYTSI
jgi:malate/lactate dehydrogenase